MRNVALRGPPVVLHALSHRGVKRTRFVLNAISRLKAEGVALELLLVEGASHTQTWRMYERADLVVDQLLTGWYGAMAVEAMAMGKPVICYIRGDDMRFIPEQMDSELPFINATPSTIYSALKDWLTTQIDRLPEVSHRSRAYVEEWHDPLNIAARLKLEYEKIMASK